MLFDRSLVDADGNFCGINTIPLHSTVREEKDQTGVVTDSTRQISVQLCTDIRGCKTVNPNDFGDPLTFHLALP